jgi:signal transduction histidine kinase
MRCRDGTVRDVVLTAAPIRDDDPSAGTVGIIFDITERKRTEQALRESEAQLRHHAESLERRVAERTAELVLALDRAQSADRLKSSFLATMSHELRTPLNSILGFSGILRQGLAGPLNEEQAKQMGMVCSSAEHLLALINDVLDLSKIEAGQLKVSTECFDLRDAVCAAVATAGPLASKKGLPVEVDLPSRAVAISSDRRRVEQILLNLLSNSIKFTASGRVRVEVLPGDTGVTVRVTDTGIGIRDQDLTELFKPFTQVDSGLSRRHEGTGLGLSICKKLVELLGGTIRVTSEWGKGSTFTFELPLDRGGT